MSTGRSLRNSGPIGHAPAAPSGSSHDRANTANTRAREHAAHQNGTNTKTKDVKSFPSPGTLGAQGHGGAI